MPVAWCIIRLAPPLNRESLFKFNKEDIMKKLLLLYIVLMGAFMWSNITHADGIHIDVVDGNCTLPNADTIPNCDVVPGPNGENPNVLVQWLRSSTRENQVTLPVEEVGGVKIYFQDVVNNWWTSYDTVSSTTENVFIYKPPASYSFTLTTYDSNGLESSPTNAIVAEVGAPTVPPVDPPVDPPTMEPKPPVIVSFTLPPSTSATIHLTPVGGAK